MTADKRFNILFLIADDHQHSALGARGHPDVLSPHLDALCAAGTNLTNVHIMGSTSGAVCMPSRGMLHTGRHLFDISAPDLGEHALLPQVLSETGYHSFGVGKWHNGPSSFARAFDGGDAIFFGGMCDHDRVPLHSFDPAGRYPPEAAQTENGFSTTLFADAAVRFLEAYREPDPFCLYVAFTAPHDPRTPPPEYAVYDPATLTLPDNFLPEHPFDNGALATRDERLAPFPRTPGAVRRHLADYYGMVTHLDAEIGRILETLEATGNLGSTLIVYTADHGLALGQHGLFGKQNLYEHSLRVPLILRGPGVPAGETRSAPVYLHDLHPTLCELTGTKVASSVMAESFVPVLGKDKGRASLFAAYRDLQRAVIRQPYKLIRYSGGHEQLFNLDEDGLETTNLAPDLPEIVADLRAELTAWQQLVHDPLLSAS